MIDKIGDRMKSFYEDRSKTFLTRRMPVIIRIDGKAFHTFTKGFEKPFDEVLNKAMQETMKYLCENIQGCVLGYTQSDEITLILIDYQTLTTEAWFNYNVQKMCSITASMATLVFNRFFHAEHIKWVAVTKMNSINYRIQSAHNTSIEKGAMFDARCFNIPKEEVANCLIWRQQDATRNSIFSAGQKYFSHKELQNKNSKEIQEMLFQKGINWNDYPITFKRGCCCIKEDEWVIDNEIPIFTENREYIERLIIFD